MELSDQVGLVKCASQDIGKPSAMGLAAAGATVVAVDGLTHQFADLGDVLIHYVTPATARRSCCCTAGHKPGGNGGT